MANEKRLRQAFIAGFITDNPLLIGATSLNSAELVNLALVDGTKHCAIVLDRDEVNGSPEIVYVTSHGAGAGVATIVRSREGTTAREHPVNTVMHVVPTLRDWKFGDITMLRYVTANLSYALTTWGDLHTDTDLVLKDVYAGDVVEVSVSGQWLSEAPVGYLDVASLVAAAEVNYWGTDGAESGTSEGVQGWTGIASAFGAVGSPVSRVVVAGDLETGQLTLRFRRRNSSAAAKQIYAQADNPLILQAVNLGPQLDHV